MPRNRILSFKYAFEGIFTAFKHEPNFKIHVLIALIVLFLAWFLQVSRTDWIILIILIGLVFSIELTNTAIEEIVDSFVTSHHPGAKKAKDVAAGAVLVSSITALIIGLLIFLPYFV